MKLDNFNGEDTMPNGIVVPRYKNMVSLISIKFDKIRGL